VTTTGWLPRTTSVQTRPELARDSAPLRASLRLIRGVPGALGELPSAPPLVMQFDSLMRATQTQDWDGDGATAIPPLEWSRAFALATRVATGREGLPPVSPNASGDGSIHLRWLTTSQKELLVELRGPTAWWTFVLPNGEVSVGERPISSDVSELSNFIVEKLVE
jgi:hypothetical protein